MNATGETDRGSRSGEIPRDDRLPGLLALLDPDRLKAMVASGGGEGLRDVARCRIFYVRYKPGTNCIVAFAAEREASRGGREAIAGAPAAAILYGKCYRPRDYATAAGKVDRDEDRGREGLAPAILLPEVASILYRYPDDRAIEGLRFASAPKKVQRLLYEHLSGFPGETWRISDKRIRATPIRYKPEKRAVIRIETRAIHRATGEKRRVCAYLRAYADERGETIAALMGALHEAFAHGPGPAVPRPLAYLPERRLLFVEEMEGTPLAERIAGPEAQAEVRWAGAALSRLHRYPDRSLPVRSAEDLLGDVRATVTMLARVAPDLGPDAEAILAALGDLARAELSGPASFVHGDFYHGQVLLGEGGGGILDFDRAYRGDPLADVGNFCAHLVRLELGGRIPDAEGLTRAFVEAYAEGAGRPPESRALALWTALGLVQLSIRPFRTLVPDWKVRTGEILASCRRILS